MNNNAFRSETASIKRRFIARRRLLKPLIVKYDDPIIVHAIHKKDTFLKIITEGKIKLPSKIVKKTPYMEKLLGLDNGIYYSIGFVYTTSYNWKYNILFDIEYIKNCKYYANPVNYRCYKAVVDYWYENDKSYLDELGKKNTTCLEVLDKYYNTKYNGKKRMMFDFWKIEKNVFEHIHNYYDRKTLLRIIHAKTKKYYKKYPLSLKDARESIDTERSPEIIGFKENNLLKNKQFIGFYIVGDVPKDIMSILKKKYSGKILYDGKKILTIEYD